MSELVLNSAHWSDTGKPVRDVIQLQNAAGFVVNVEATGEPPLRLPQCVCHNGRPSFDRAEGDPAGVRRDPNYADAAHGLDLGVVEDRSGLFGAASSPEQFNDCTYMDEDAGEMESRRRKLRADLGLDTEENPERARQQRQRKMDAGLSPFPGAPAKSFG